MEATGARCATAHKSAVIALDFGSTNSAAVVTVPGLRYPKSRQQIFACVHKFPTTLSVLDRTTPTTVEFTPPGEDPSSDRVLKYFKLTLMDALDKSDPEGTWKLAEESAEGLNTSADPGVVAVFLSGLWDLALQKLKDNFPQQGKMSPHVVVTYTGVFNASELRRFKSIVRDAGIEKASCQTCGVFYQTEQEAAVRAVLVDHEEKLQDLRKNGDTIIVTDCGGMTTDSAIFTFNSSDGHNPQPLGSIDGQESGYFGGESLDRAIREKFDEGLHDFIKDYHHESGLPKDISNDIPHIREDFVHRVKWQFRGKSLYGNSINCAVGNHAMVFDRSTVSKIIDPLVKKIVAQILSLYRKAKDADKKPKLVVLTGGISQQPRVGMCVVQMLKTSGEIECLEVITSGPWEAMHSVCRGAALSQLIH